jgi:alkanesulfonate monooxygenase SsuD/methylene tetrahydromethanopterin reductase-like flavin-dependent oxidoreductase (luciferase family)
MGVVATLLTPLHHPVDLAERAATMDVITGGNFILAAALGYRDEEYDAFQVKRRQRVSRQMECLEVMRRLWTEEEVTFQGRHFSLENARAALKPVQKPHPPVWVAANSDAAIKRAANRGFTWYVNPHATYATIARQVQLYHDTAAAAGSDVPQDLPIGREVFVHEDRERAFREVRPYLGGKYEAYAQWGQDKALPGDESFGTSFEELARDRFIIGDPEDCITELEKYRELGMACGSFLMMWPGMELREGLRNMELFANRVMPHLR